MVDDVADDEVVETYTFNGRQFDDRIISIEQAKRDAQERRRRGGEGGGRPPKYPWGEYLDGHARYLTKGEDFDCEVDSFVNLFCRRCRREHLSARWRVDYDHDAVTVWAVGLDGRSLVPEDEGDPSLLPGHTSDPDASDAIDAELERTYEALMGDGLVDADPWVD